MPFSNRVNDDFLTPLGCSPGYVEIPRGETKQYPDSELIVFNLNIRIRDSLINIDEYLKVAQQISRSVHGFKSAEVVERFLAVGYLGGWFYYAPRSSELIP